MDHEVLKEIEKALVESKTLETLTLSDDDGVTIPKEFCRHVLFGIGRNTYLSEVHLNFLPCNWDCPRNGKLVYVSHMLCASVGCGV